MASIVTYRNKWLRLHKSYEKRALKVFNNAFKTWGAAIPFDFINEGNYKALVAGAINKETMFNAYAEVYTEIGKAHGKRVGKAVNQELKVFTFSSFISLFERSLFQWLFTNGGARIVLVQQAYITHINRLIASGLADGQTIQQITTRLKTLVTRSNFYRWQALRIARTETTTASNFAATVAGDVSGFVMEKMWISALDARTRRPPESHFNHYEMNGKKVGQNDVFVVGGEKLLFPGAPTGSAGNVINCRCTVALIPKRDSEGNLVRT